MCPILSHAVSQLVRWLGLYRTRGTYPRVLLHASGILAPGTVGLVTCSFVSGLAGAAP
jgi:hypothetical protein